MLGHGPGHLTGGDRVVESLQREVAQVAEGVGATAADERPNEGRGENLAPLGPVAEPLGHDDGGAEVVVVFAQGFAGVQSHPNGQRF